MGTFLVFHNECAVHDYLFIINCQDKLNMIWGLRYVEYCFYIKLYCITASVVLFFQWRHKRLCWPSLL